MAVKATLYTERRCGHCKLTKPIEEFYKQRKEGRKHVQTYTVCKACCREKARVHNENPVYRAARLARRKAWRTQHPERQNVNWRDRSYKRTYNTTVMAYDLQLAAQNGRCAVCLRLPAEGEQRFAFDHNHVTGQARGVLCPACNGGLGCFRDNPELLKAGITYLRHWAAQEVEKAG